MLAVGATLGATVGAVQSAYADPTTPVKVHVSDVHVDSGIVTVSGTVTTANGDGIPGLAVSITMDGSLVASAITGSQGGFSAAFGAPGAGRHSVMVEWAGDSQYSGASGGASFTIATTPSKTSSALTLTLDPTSTMPGTLVTITGTLTGGGSGIGSALVTLGTTYGDVDATVATGGDGAFTATLSVPPDPDYPASITVTVAFGGDAVYNGSTNQATLAITAPPAPSATPSPSATPKPTTSASASATPTVGLNAGGTQPLDFVSDTHLRIVGTAFSAVALVAIGSLLVLGIVSHANKKLGRGERRGFGTNFGKEA
jgi:hypothetical protein